jgi:DNA-binding CsgD family transcriptional regulator
LEQTVRAEYYRPNQELPVKAMASFPQSSAGDGRKLERQTVVSLGEGNPLAASRLASPNAQEHDHGQPSVGPPLTSFSRDATVCDDGSAAARDVMAALTFGLDLVQHGAMLVAAEGRPRLANRVALTILQKKDGLLLSRTGLVAERAADTRLLQQLLQDAIKAPELGEPEGSPITLQRRTAHNSLIVRVVPGPGLECWPGTENRTALLKLYDQDLGLEVDAGDLCRLYGLTRGEAALAVLLVRGKSIEEAADELFISPHTARTHLKRIFMKTDTHRQSELVVRILTVVL